jgi:hypothetical protein
MDFQVGPEYRSEFPHQLIPAPSPLVSRDELPRCHTTALHSLDLYEMHPGWAVAVILDK